MAVGAFCYLAAAAARLRGATGSYWTIVDLLPADAQLLARSAASLRVANVSQIVGPHRI